MILKVLQPVVIVRTKGIRRRLVEPDEAAIEAKRVAANERAKRWYTNNRDRVRKAQNEQRAKPEVKAKNYKKHREWVENNRGWVSARLAKGWEEKWKWNRLERQLAASLLNNFHETNCSP